MSPKEEALQALNHATTLIHDCKGDHWQMAYEVLEAVFLNLQYAPEEDSDESL